MDCDMDCDMYNSNTEANQNDDDWIKKRRVVRGVGEYYEKGRRPGSTGLSIAILGSCEVKSPYILTKL